MQILCNKEATTKKQTHTEAFSGVLRENKAAKIMSIKMFKKTVLVHLTLTYNLGQLKKLTPKIQKEASNGGNKLLSMYI